MNPLRELLLTQDRAAAEGYFRAHTRSQYLGKGVVLCSILGGKKMFALGSDVSFSIHMITDGFWEFWLTKCIAEHVHEGDVVLDVGANLGYYTLLAGDLVGPEGRVVAVEPNPTLFRQMMDSVNANGYGAKVTGLRAALSDQAPGSSAPFLCPVAHPLNGRFLQSDDNPELLGQEGPIIDVDILDDLSSHFERLDFIKIDVEGAELAVLRSLLPLIKTYQPKVVCEFKFTRGYSYDDLIELLGVETLHHLEFDSTIVPLTKDMTETQRHDQDWLVCLNF